MNITISTALNMSLSLFAVFEKMESPYWALSYDPFVLNAFKLMTIRGNPPYYIDDKLIDINPLPDGIYGYKLGEDKCYDREGHYLRYTRSIYNVFIYEFNEDVVSWLEDIYPKIPKSWNDYIDYFNHVNYETNEKFMGISKEAMHIKYTNPREYVTQQWLDMLLSGDFDTPYHLERATNHFDNDITYIPEKRSRRKDVYRLGF